MSIKRKYFLLNLTNYLAGFFVSAIFTFAYTDWASSIFFIKQVLSSFLCLLFVTIPFERALVRNESSVSITVSKLQIILGIVVYCTAIFWLGFYTNQWILTIAILGLGSILQLCIGILSVTWIVNASPIKSVFATMLARVIDFFPITLLEVYSLPNSIVFWYYAGIVLVFLYFAYSLVNIRSANVHFFNYELLRIGTMLFEIFLSSYILLNVDNPKIFFFANALVGVFITLLFNQIWRQINIQTSPMLLITVLISIMSKLYPLVALVGIRVIGYCGGLSGRKFFILMPLIYLVTYSFSDLQLNITIVMVGYGLITAMNSYSFRLMDHKKVSE